MRRILEATTREGDLIGDFYCGSGSMLVAAELLGRRWVASDCNVHAVELTKLRLSAFGVQSPVIEMNQETRSDGNSFWLVPLINENDIHAARTVKIPLPTLALHRGTFVLEHVNWRVWALYNVPYVTLNNGRHVFEWKKIQERVDELLSLPKERFIQESFHESSGIRVRDIFGRSYHFQIRTKTNRQA
ncbi:site-specific DNA-methyltransferase [Paenibacillus aceris]|nr:site-specific DNA-methyltransferase [Paenibacillus aceris]